MPEQSIIIDNFKCHAILIVRISCVGVFSVNYYLETADSYRRENLEATHDRT